jgi:hypothetical protein
VDSPVALATEEPEPEQAGAHDGTEKDRERFLQERRRTEGKELSQWFRETAQLDGQRLAAAELAAETAMLAGLDSLLLLHSAGVLRDVFTQEGVWTAVEQALNSTLRLMEPMRDEAAEACRQETARRIHAEELADDAEVSLESCMQEFRQKLGLDRELTAWEQHHVVCTVRDAGWYASSDEEEDDEEGGEKRRTKPVVSEAAIAAMLRTILAGMTLEQVRLKAIRLQLEEHFGANLGEQKKVIKRITAQILVEGEEEAEEAGATEEGADEVGTEEEGAVAAALTSTVAARAVVALPAMWQPAPCSAAALPGPWQQERKRQQQQLQQAEHGWGRGQQAEREQRAEEERAMLAALSDEQLKQQLRAAGKQVHDGMDKDELVRKLQAFNQERREGRKRKRGTAGSDRKFKKRSSKRQAKEAKQAMDPVQRAATTKLQAAAEKTLAQVNAAVLTGNFANVTHAASNASAGLRKVVRTTSKRVVLGGAQLRRKEQKKAQEMAKAKREWAKEASHRSKQKQGRQVRKQLQRSKGGHSNGRSNNGSGGSSKDVSGISSSSSGSSGGSPEKPTAAESAARQAAERAAAAASAAKEAADAREAAVTRRNSSPPSPLTPRGNGDGASGGSPGASLTLPSAQGFGGGASGMKLSALKAAQQETAATVMQRFDSASPVSSPGAGDSVEAMFEGLLVPVGLLCSCLVAFILVPPLPPCVFSSLRLSFLALFVFGFKWSTWFMWFM